MIEKSRDMSDVTREDNDLSWTRVIAFFSACALIRAGDGREAGPLMQVAVTVIADLHLDPFPGGLKPDTRYIRASTSLSPASVLHFHEAPVSQQ